MRTFSKMFLVAPSCVVLAAVSYLGPARASAEGAGDSADPTNTAPVHYDQILSDEEIASRLEAAEGDRYALPFSEAFREAEVSEADESSDAAGVGSFAGILDNLRSLQDVPSVSDLDAPTAGDYAHLWPSAEDRVRDAAAHLFTEVAGSGEGTVRANRP
jgi:hypothetical protein